MKHSTTVTYQMKREILKFANRLSGDTSKDWAKLTGDMLFGILASGSCILSQMADTLHEGIKKKNTVGRLSRKLLEKHPEQIRKNYLRYIKQCIDTKGVVHVDDSDISKPYGKNLRRWDWFGMLPSSNQPLKKAIM